MIDIDAECRGNEWACVQFDVHAKDIGVGVFLVVKEASNMFLELRQAKVLGEMGECFRVPRAVVRNSILMYHCATTNREDHHHYRS